MRRLPALAVLTLAAALSGSAAAQSPFPFGGPQVPEPGKFAKCTKNSTATKSATIGTAGGSLTAGASSNDSTSDSLSDLGSERPMRGMAICAVGSSRTRPSRTR